MAIFERYCEPPQRSIASVSARRTRTSAIFGLLWFGVTISTQFQSLSCTVTLSARAATSSSRCLGGKPRNSMSAWPPSIACTRADILVAMMAL